MKETERHAGLFSAMRAFLCHASFSLSSRACRGINAERSAGTLGHRGKETRLLANLRLLRSFGLSFRATWWVLSARWCEEVLDHAIPPINSFFSEVSNAHPVALAERVRAYSAPGRCRCGKKRTQMSGIAQVAADFRNSRAKSPI